MSKQSSIDLKEIIKSLSHYPALTSGQEQNALPFLVISPDGREIIAASPVAEMIRQALVSSGSGQITSNALQDSLQRLIPLLIHSANPAQARLPLDPRGLSAPLPCTCFMLSLPENRQVLICILNDLPLHSGNIRKYPDQVSMTDIPSQPEEPLRKTVRFLWHTDLKGHFTEISRDLTVISLLKETDLHDRSWQDLQKICLETDHGSLEKVFNNQQSWHGLKLLWPTSEEAVFVPVELSGNPVFDQKNIFCGFSGFGLCRLAEKQIINPQDETIKTEYPVSISAEDNISGSDSDILQQEKRDSVETGILTGQDGLNAEEQTTFRNIAQALLKGADSAASTEETEKNSPLVQNKQDNISKVKAEIAETDTDYLDDEEIMFETEAAELDDLLADFSISAEETGKVEELKANSDLLSDDPEEDAADPDYFSLMSDQQNLDEPALLSTDLFSYIDLESFPDPEHEASPDARGSDTSDSDASSPDTSEQDAFSDFRSDTAYAQNDLLQRIRELESILDTATDGVVTISEKGTIQSLNRSAEALFGYEEHEVKGESVTILLARESHIIILDYLDNLVNGGMRSLLNGREVLGRVRQGGTIPLFLTMGDVATEAERQFCIVARDMTTFKKVEQELVQAKKAAERANKHKSDFLAKISHEVRTPMNAIIGFTELMKEERFGAVGNPRYRDYLKDIWESGQYIVSLIDDLLDLAKIEAGTMDLSFQPVQLNELVTRSMNILQQEAVKEKIILRTGLNAHMPPIVADERSLQQIILNLLSNAIKYTNAGGQIIISTSLTDFGEAVLRVRDTGIGMKEEEILLAFEPFKRLSTSRKRKGSGLGLSVTKALVEANRGLLHLSASPGQGTLAEIIFPPTRVLVE